MKPVKLFATLAALLLLLACTPSRPTESSLATSAVSATVASGLATTIPLTAVTPRPARPNTAVEPTTVTPEPSVVTVEPATATPMPGQAFSIWWTVQPETTADGRPVYRVDQPEVKEMVGAQYYEILTFYSNQNGLSDLSRAAYYSVEKEIPLREASRAAAIQQGWYWRIPVPQVLHWDGEPEFSADGSEVTWTFVIADEQITAENLYSRQVSIEAGAVMQEVRLPALRQTVFLQYDPQQGRWRLDDARSHMELLPSATPGS